MEERDTFQKALTIELPVVVLLAARQEEFLAKKKDDRRKNRGRENCIHNIIKIRSYDGDSHRTLSDENAAGSRPFVVEANRVRETSQYIALH
ncbi:hypothetical protein WH47_07312 [Habropoda laboriosa]|uniref:Uncharacterized protein n=1 Tax=Habropoda laboriosa TaxID=597456 RepID=A0A0L7R5X3_9HYME|nr:hypothetical protein WH47_07312 [Habropoda laboriosa]